MPARSPETPRALRARAPSVRQLRVGEVIRQALAAILNRGGLHDPVLENASITITQVSVSPDLRQATAYAAPLSGGASPPWEVIAALTRARGALRYRLGRAVHLKWTPDLAFVADPAFDAAQAVDRILDSPGVARDLEACASAGGSGGSADSP